MPRPRHTRPQLSEECVYNISKAASEVLVRSLIGGNDLNYVAHKGCVRRASADGRKHQEFLEKAELTRRKELADGAGLNCLCHKLIMGHGSQLYLIALMAHSCHGMNSKKISFSNMALFP